MTKALDSIIKWSFYLLFFFVPLVFFSGSFELFEYNKMMVTYALGVVITFAWITKIIISPKDKENKSLFLGIVRRTPLDIPILIYLISHIISTILSIDFQTSVWGYYSRFHEGLVASFCYIILFYAAVTNLKKDDVIKLFYFSFASGIIASLWGILEHFGSSPSCYFITGSSGVDCWIQDVKNRVFATLGQPNWMAAYLDVLILISLGFCLTLTNKSKSISLQTLRYPLLGVIFTIALLFTKSRSGVIGLIIGLGIFGFFYILAKLNSKNSKEQLFTKPLVVFSSLLVAAVIIFGLPFAQTEKLSLEKLLTSSSSQSKQELSKPVDPGIRISESSDIRNIVWNGAIRIWQRYPIFGSGVETFAYAYYKDRPVEHNMVSEWDFLYNKAHNEYLNILATTGAVGMFAYLLFIGMYIWWFIKSKKDPLTIGLFAAWTTILVTNFFGFSVVIIGLFFFLIPAFNFILADTKETKALPLKPIKTGQWVAITVLSLLALFLLYRLLIMWLADKSFAYGKNLDGINQYQTAYQYLVDSVELSPTEPTFRDELAYNQSVLALAFYKQSSSSAEAKYLTEESVKNSNIVLETSPNILSFWKTRTRLFYNLAEIDKRYLFEALSAIRKAAELAPTDAKVNYNYGLLLGQTGDINNGISVLKKVTQMKPDYADAYYALGIYYAEKGDKTKAREQMEYMLKNIGNDERAEKWLKENPVN